MMGQHFCLMHELRGNGSTNESDRPLELRHLRALRLPDLHFMPIFRGLPYWKPHKICIKCYFSTAQCVTMRWIAANL
jgi:hypothetical protein